MMAERIDALSEKEKQTLRLLIRGHDAKSAARALGLSVHTINERLRDARRKLAVSSSREAARLLLEREAQVPESFVDKRIGEAMPAVDMAASRPPDGSARPSRPLIIASGGLLMSFVFALLVVTTAPQTSAPLTPTVSAGPDSMVAEANARRWLALVDQGRWQESWAATAPSFRKLNTVQVWTAASERARVPLGAMLKRTLVDQQSVPGPPSGYQTVRFRTDFTNRAGAIETLSLAREDGEWRVVGIYIE